MKVAFHTLGCKVNQDDTESLMTLFRERGYDIVPFGPGADIYVINTCAVTQTGAGKSRQSIRKAIGYGSGIVVATGCYSQVSPEEAGGIEGVDLLVGMAERPQIVDLVEKYLADRQKRLHIEILEHDGWIDLPHGLVSGRTRAMLKIEEGCEQFCSYCIIPYARGKVRSMPLERVVAEFKKLVEAGYREIVLTGIHLGCYGKDLGLTLDDVLRELTVLSGEFRIRLGSIEPTDFTEGLIRRIAGHPRICQYLHIPLQSGSDRVLERMNRGYRLDYFRDLLQELRSMNPLIGIGTDLIVGFPGETDEDFENTLEFVKEQRFSKMHVFRYSPRKGTPATMLPDRVPGKIQEERSRRISEIALQMSRAFADRFIGRTVEVLFEEREGLYWTGLSGEYIPVKAESGQDLKNKVCQVKITENEGERLIGVLIPDTYHSAVSFTKKSGDSEGI